MIAPRVKVSVRLRHLQSANPRVVEAKGDVLRERSACNDRVHRSATRLSVLVLHDDAAREYAYGPAQGMPDTKIGTPARRCTTWRRIGPGIVISMKNDWQRIFAFES